MSASGKKRVVVWGTGFVGRLVIPEIVKHPSFELVGVGVSNPEKIGKDVGTICGLGRVGLAATDDVAALVATRPDALVHYGPTAAYARDNIRCNMVVPSWMWGPPVEMFVKGQAKQSKVSKEEALQGIVGGFPLRRMTEDGEVADVVAFFMSDLAKAVTGQYLLVNSGEMMR